ncbi:hypothetical protein J1N35_011341 [Gossypium stocksii]|uniref:Uncharacterized protein n=1 Tax=Gossypium stocksii TaxID=47602 RepID=A0A9D3W3B6_9ROSI|nr:hypothetical protein J1N35_011341 [Gossypium stocksii]
MRKCEIYFATVQGRNRCLIETPLLFGGRDLRNSSAKEMAKVTTGFEHITTMPKFKRRKVSIVRDFPPGCGREATTDLGLHRQIAVDQGKYSFSISK